MKFRNVARKSTRNGPPKRHVADLLAEAHQNNEKVKKKRSFSPQNMDNVKKVKISVKSESGDDQAQQERVKKHSNSMEKDIPEENTKMNMKTEKREEKNTSNKTKLESTIKTTEAETKSVKNADNSDKIKKKYKYKTAVLNMMTETKDKLKKLKDQCEIDKATEKEEKERRNSGDSNSQCNKRENKKKTPEKKELKMKRSNSREDRIDDEKRGNNHSDKEMESIKDEIDDVKDEHVLFENLCNVKNDLSSLRKGKSVASSNEQSINNLAFIPKNVHVRHTGIYCQKIMIKEGLNWQPPDMPIGWVRQVIPRSLGSYLTTRRIADVYYISPHGRRFRSFPEISKYIKEAKLKINASVFTFNINNLIPCNLPSEERRKIMLEEMIQLEAHSVCQKTKRVNIQE